MKKTLSCFLLFALGFAHLSFADDENFAAQKQLYSMMEAQPVMFEENKGQFKDMAGNAVPDLLFRATLNGGYVYITDKGLSYVFSNTKKESTVETSNKTFKTEGKRKIDWCRQDIELIGANIKLTNIQKHSPSLAHINYYQAHCTNGVIDVKMYEKIIITNIYPGIDWILYSSHHQGFKYDFYVHPGADVSLIKMHYKGAGEVSVTDTTINVTTRLGDIFEGRLYSYEEGSGSKIQSSYIRAADTVCFKVGERNLNEALIIDPPVHIRSWATCFSGSIVPIQGGIAGGVCGPEDIKVDANGNVFATGYVSNSDFPLLNPGGGAYYDATLNYTTNISYTDAFILKFNNAGVLLWATFYGGKLEDYGSSVAIDNAGNLFVTGHTASTDFPIQNPGGGAYYQNANAGGGGNVFTNGDVFILKFSNNGVRQWATYYGGNHSDGNVWGLCGPSVATDINGNVFITGFTLSTNFPTFNPGGGAYYQPVLNNNAAITNKSDIFILKFNNSGVRLWATYFGGSDDEAGIGITTDLLGNLWITGWTRSSNFPLQNIGGGAYFQNVYAGVSAVNCIQTSGGDGDAFILKFNNSSVLQWSTYYGAQDHDGGTGITTDSKGNVFVTGFTGTCKAWGSTSPGATNFPVFNPGGCAYFQGGSGGATDFFILKFNNAGIRLWATYYGGRDDDAAVGLTRGPGITCDVYGNIFIAGASGNGCTTPIIGDFPLYNPGGAFIQNNLQGCEDIVIMKFRNDGQRLWATYYGSSGGGGGGVDWAEAIATDANGNLFVTGEAWSPTFQTQTPGAGAYYQTHTVSKDNGFFLKFDKTCPLVLATNQTNASCGNTGTASVIPNPLPANCSPYYYLWSTGQTTSSISNLAVGSYSVLVSDSTGCFATASVNILPASGAAVTSSQNINICAGDVFVLPGGSTANVSGIYIDTLISSSGCDSIITTQLFVNAVGTQSVSVGICPGAFYQLPGGVIANMSGIYNDTLLSSLGCDSIVITNLTVGSPLNTNSTRQVCQGQSVVIHGVNQNAAGVYTQTFTAVGGCDSISTVTLNVNAIVTNTISPSSCVSYTHNSQVYNSSGVYTQTLSGISGCDSLLIIDLTINNAISTVLNQNVCSGQSTLIHGILQNTPGIYTNTFTTINGCDSVSSVTLNVLPVISNTVTVNTCNTYIHNGINYFASGIYTQTLISVSGCDSLLTIDLTLSFSATNSQEITICPGETVSIHGQLCSAAGVYSNTFVAANGCDSISTITLSLHPPAIASFQINPNPAESNTPVNFIDLSVGATAWNWSFGDALNSSSTNQHPVFVYFDSAHYQVQLVVKNDYGCTDTAMQGLYIRPEFIFYAPNTFTPDGDNLNDVFLPIGMGIDVSSYELYIFDRWGNEIFTSQNPSVGWDGRANGGVDVAQIDTYVWIVKLKAVNGISGRYAGHVNLLK